MNVRRSLLATALMALAGCASTQLDAEWRDPQLSPGSLRGARVLVACDAFEAVVVQLCRDQIASAVAAQGAIPVFVPTNFPVSPTRAVDPQLLLAARDAGAKAMLVVTVAVASSNVSQGMSIGIGASASARAAAPASASQRRSARQRDPGYAANGRHRPRRANACSGPRRRRHRRRATSTRR
jgi:hypothetical protein